LKEKIIKINRLLISYFGIPARPKKLPDPIDTLIATILSQNTNDNNSYKAYQNLKKKYKTLDALAQAKRTEIEKVIRIAGLGKQKSATIKNFFNSLRKENEKIDFRIINKLDDEEILGELT